MSPDFRKAAITPTLFVTLISVAAAQNNSGGNQSKPARADSIKAIPDLAYAGNKNPRQMLDLYLPKKRGTELLPVVIYIHGGGWRSGARDRGVKRLTPFVSTGQYAGVSVGYRLSDEAQWPSQIHDGKAAIRWIRAHAEEYGLDPDRIGIFGTSAGAHLVSVLGTTGDVPAMEGKLGPHTDQSSRVTCVADLYGPTNFLTMNRTAAPGAKLDHDSPNSPESLLIGGPIQENPAKVATANPITYITSDDPPFLIIHGTLDPLVSFNQSELLHQALLSSDLGSTLVTVTGGGHGKGFPAATNERVARFFDHHLRDIKTEWIDHALPSDPWR